MPKTELSICRVCRKYLEFHSTDELIICTDIALGRAKKTKLPQGLGYLNSPVFSQCAYYIKFYDTTDWPVAEHIPNEPFKYCSYACECVAKGIDILSAS